MSFFKKGDTPIGTIVEKKECERTYKFVSSVKPYKNLGGYDYPGEMGFTATHEIGKQKVYIREMSGILWGSEERIGLTTRSQVEALIETLQDVLTEW
jgi:hypothetical protein